MSKKIFSESRIKRVVGASLVAVALVSTNAIPASATEEVRPIEIVVQAAPGLCDGFTDTPASWSPGSDMSYTSPDQVGTSPFTVQGNTIVELELVVGWTIGSACVGGVVNDVFPSGVVQANWTLESPLNFTFTLCQETACEAGLGGILANVEVPVGIDAGSYDGSLTLTWIP